MKMRNSVQFLLTICMVYSFLEVTLLNIMKGFTIPVFEKDKKYQNLTEISKV